MALKDDQIQIFNAKRDGGEMPNLYTLQNELKVTQ